MYPDHGPPLAPSSNDAKATVLFKQAVSIETSAFDPSSTKAGHMLIDILLGIPFNRDNLNAAVSEFSGYYSSAIHKTILAKQKYVAGSGDSGQSANLVLSDYADIPHNDDEIMYTASQDDDRPTNRIYRFLTSSRSRSRSKQSSSNDVQNQSTELAHEPHESNPGSHSRESTWSSRTSDRGRSSHRSSAKPSTILPSRPLSSTTTATNTTVTPSTPKGKKRMAQASSAAPSSTLSEASHENFHPPPPETTPKHRSSTRRKLRQIFGIHSRKSSISSSRGTSPGHSHNLPIQPPEVPPLPPYPDMFTSHDPSHFERTQSPDPISSSRPQSPSPQPHPDPLTSSVSTTASSNSKIDFTKFFSPGSRTRPLLNPRRSSTASLSTPPSSSDSILHHVSSPTKHKRASTSASDANAPHTRGTSTQSRNASSSSKGTGTSEASGSNGHAASASLRPPYSSRSAPTSPRMSHRKDSIDSTHRYRPLVIVNEEKERESLDYSPSPKGKGKELDQSPSSRADKNNGSDTLDSRNANATAVRSRNGGQQSMRPPKQVSIRGTKHGSFDFERPSWAVGGLLSRSMSGNGHSRSPARSPAKSPEEKPRNGVASNGRGGAKSERKENGGTPPSSSLEAWRRQRTHRTPPPKTAPLHEDDTPTPTPTKGQSSSLGKSSGKRMLGSGVTRLAGLAHGPFSFEPAVPSPTFSHTSASTAGHSEADNGRKDGRDRRKRDREVAKEGDLSRSTSTKSKATEPDSILSSTSGGGGSSRAAGRGRSLDLGLGLSWAPTRVREDALLPAGKFMSRKSPSAPSRKGVATRHVEFEDERTKVGQEIAEVFKRVLDEDAFIAFKHYVHQFDSHEIPFDGPTGIIARTERLLGKASSLGPEDQQNLVNKLIRVILHNT
ncbi:hypothetical protein V5O48_008844 [Marasmius crinis-equi]|uniref:Uncharacterized protein n=1 Tax=Marasmius crinis-equi TaxID=585013 RepID=A0ABR3FDG0_9AGAR